MNEAIADGAAEGRLVPFDLAALAARIGTAAYFDPVRFYQAKLPFSFEAGPVVADGLAALIATMTGKSGRALVLDLDNTLWGGVIGDDGIEGIRLGQGSRHGEAFLAFQRHVAMLARRGVILAVCSKNDGDRREAFTGHPEMALRRATSPPSWRTGTTRPTTSARSPAPRIGLDSLVFVDDNPAERDIVRRELPMVTVPELPDDLAHFPALAAAGYFEAAGFTADDAARPATLRPTPSGWPRWSRRPTWRAYLRRFA